MIYCSALCSCTVFNLSHNKIQCSPTVFVHNILIIFDFSTTLLLHYGASSMKLSPPWLHNSTEHPKLIYMKISCSTHNLGRMDLKFYEHVLVASEMDEANTIWVELIQKFSASWQQWQWQCFKKIFWPKFWWHRLIFCFLSH